MRFSDREQYTHLPNEIKTTRPHVDRQNNIIIGIAIGVMIVVCGIIYVVSSI